MIREARPGDRAAIERLQQQLPEPAPALITEVAGGEILVATLGTQRERPVGYLLWFPRTPVYVAELVIDTEYRRKGRGEALVRALFDRLPEGTAVELRVGADNEVAQAFYRKLGFEYVATEPDAFETNPGYLMRTVCGEP